MNEKLTKSLESLDLAADELIQKSTPNKETEEIFKDAGIKKGADCKDGEDCDDDSLKKSDEDTEDAEDISEDSGKSDDSDKSDKEDDGDEADTKKSLEDFQSNITDSFMEDSDISNGAGSSEFQAGIVAAMAKSLAEIQYDIYNNAKGNNTATSVLVKSLQAVISANNNLRAENDKLSRQISRLEKSFDRNFSTIMDAIDNISNQPAHMRKSVGSVNIHDKNFSTSLTGNASNDFDSLSKSQVLNVLTNQVYAGNTAVTANDIVSFESGAPLRPELQALVVNNFK